MKRTASSVFIVILFATAAFAQTTAFRYQGSLKNAGNPASGNYDFEFLLFDAVSGGAQIGATLSMPSVAVANGGFSVELDFGNQFPGQDRFLEIQVRQSGGGAFTPLAPRQAITSAPYSVKSVNAENAASATNSLQLGGVAANQYVVTNDPRMNDARDPLPGSTSYIHNQNAAPQAISNFNVSGTGTANILTASTQFNIGANRILANPGTNNLFAGRNAGTVNTGIRNSFFGDSAGAANSSGAANTFVGFGAGQLTTSGNNNSFFGSSAGVSNVGGEQNAIFGTGAGLSFANASRNSFFGTAAGQGIQGASGSDNSYFGYQSGQGTSSGQGNSSFGSQSGTTNQTGSFNALFGSSAGANNTDNSNNTLIGSISDSAAGVSNSTALGYRAKVTQSNSLILGSINGINGATANTRVGIGTTSPVAPLEAVGNWTGEEGALRLTGDRPTFRMTGGAAAGNQSWILHMGSIGPGNLEFYRTCGPTCWLQSLTMSTTGKVGVNVTPSHALHVVSADNTGLRVQTNSTGGTVASFGSNGDFMIDQTTPSLAGGRLIVKENGNVGIRFVNPGVALEVGGAIRTSFSMITRDMFITAFPQGSSTHICISFDGLLGICSSSLRYKRNVQSFSRGLDVVQRLRPITFNWKDGGNAGLGFAAEEVEQIEPLLANYDKDGVITGVKYGEVTTVLVNAVKEQQAQIEEQKKQLEKQQQQIDALKGLVCQQNSGAAICREDK